MISAVRPYYDWPLPLDYTFIVQAYPFRPTLNSTSQCSYLNAPTSVNFQATINNVTYPTRIPLYLDKRLNFTCLNSPSYTNPKTILLWNKFLGAPLFDYGSGHRQPFIDHKCPVTNCLITSDRSKITNADLVLFHMRSRINEFPPVRFSWQRWVYVVFESPQHCPMCHRFKNVFNMSATYKMASDFILLFRARENIWAGSSGKRPRASRSESRRIREYFRVGGRFKSLKNQKKPTYLALFVLDSDHAIGIVLAGYFGLEDQHR